MVMVVVIVHYCTETNGLVRPRFSGEKSATQKHLLDFKEPTEHFTLLQREVLLEALAVEHCFVDDYGNSGLMIEMQRNSVT